jgi:hypothetical protein
MWQWWRNGQPWPSGVLGAAVLGRAYRHDDDRLAVEAKCEAEEQSQN